MTAMTAIEPNTETTLAQLPRSVRWGLNFHLTKLIETDEALKTCWFAFRYRKEVLDTNREDLKETREYLRLFRTTATENGLNARQILRLLLKQLRQQRPPVKVLSEAQVSRWFGGG